MPLLRAVLVNRSRYAIDVVWENAQDLEHVPFLHADTNKSFTLLHAERDSSSDNVYDTLIYRATRRLGPLALASFGFRRIIRRYQIHQVEYLPLFGVTSALNSMLLESGDGEFPTTLKDEVVMEVPRWLAPFEGWIARSLRRHAAIQCGQDEPFRERRTLLKEKGVHLPFRFFNESVFNRLTAEFKERLPGVALR